MSDQSEQSIFLTAVHPKQNRRVNSVTSRPVKLDVSEAGIQGHNLPIGLLPTLLDRNEKPSILQILAGQSQRRTVRQAPAYRNRSRLHFF